MTTLKKLILTILLVLPAIGIAEAKTVDEVTLVVTSNGSTKDEAIKNALRLAVEQTYGVFVSANTDILNDDLVKDEIATVSSGNIKKFTEVANSKSENSYTVTLEVIVSKGKLLSYAKRKGANCDLDGASLASDIELQILYKRNEEAAIQNLISELLIRLDNCFDYELFVNNFSYTPQEVRWDYIDSSYDLIPSNTQYSGESVSIPYKVTATLNKKGVSTFTQFIEKISSLALKTDLDYDNGYAIDNIFLTPFVTIKENKEYPEYSGPLRYKVEDKFPRIMLRSTESVNSLNNLFRRNGRNPWSTPISQWLADCSVDVGDGDLNNLNIKVCGKGCILNGNFSTDHRWNCLDEIRLEEGAEYYFSFGTINLSIDEVKKLKNLKVVHN